MSATRITAAPEQTGDSRDVEAARPARQEEPAAAALLAAAGNQAMSRRGVVSDDAVTAMRADADRIVEKLKEQVLDAEEEQEVLNWVQAWADWDTSYARTGGAGTPYLDRFLQVLKGRTFSRATGRKLFGLAGDEWLNAYDALFHEMEDERLERFKAIVARSGKEGTPGPESRQMDSVYSVVGKHVGLGAFGIFKQTTVAVGGLADAVIWCDWKLHGRPGEPPQITPGVAKQYDEWSKDLAEIAATEDVSKDELLESFGTGDRHGQVVGILMLAGTGSAGLVIKGTVTAAQVAQGVQGLAAAADKIALRIAKLKKANPQATWGDFISDSEVLLELLNGLAALVGILGSVAGDQGALAKFLKRCGLAVDVVALAPMIAEAVKHYTSEETASNPELRMQNLQLDIEKIVATVASIIGGKHDAKVAQAKLEAAAGGSSSGGQPPGEGGGGGGGGGEGPGGGAELGRPELLEPHPADPQTGLIKEGPEFIPEKGLEVDPAVRDQLLEGKGSFIGEPEPTTVVPQQPEPVPAEPLGRTAHTDEKGNVTYTEPRPGPVVERLQRPGGSEPELLSAAPDEPAVTPRQDEHPEQSFDESLAEDAQQAQDEAARQRVEGVDPEPPEQDAADTQRGGADLDEANRIPELESGHDPTWAPEGRHRFPAEHRGTWVEGSPGDGRWQPHDPGAFGLEAGQSIPFREGVPDFTEHAVATPSGNPGVLEVPGLTGNGHGDYYLAVHELAAREGWTFNEAQNWLHENNLRIHHYGGAEMQIVPERLHGALAHQGSATELRD